MDRIQQSHILADLEKKIVLLVGPRQAGKTWLSKNLMQYFSSPVYLNYDNLQDRSIIMEQAWLNDVNFLILDELHKMDGWKNYLKGLYDTKNENLKILVTGSARLDIFDYLGDSLAGRYFRHRLLPISLAELKQLGSELPLNKLVERSGFPEPFLSEDDVTASRWRMQYINSLLSTDVFDFEKIHNIRALQLIFKLLQSRVGSPVSYQSLAEDVNISPTTVKKYIQILESIYVIFRITPFSKNIARSLLKEPKIYFFDTGLVNGDKGAKFENHLAVSLLRHCYAKVDYEAKEYKLQYIRTKDGKEVDFALIYDDEIESLIEAKYNNKNVSKNLIAFHNKYQLPAIQVVQHLSNGYTKNGVTVVGALKYLSELSL
jgi:predicted AAA+ superfamily ATPase